MEPIAAEVLEGVVELVTEEVDMGDLGGGATQQGGLCSGREGEGGSKSLIPCRR